MSGLPTGAYVMPNGRVVLYGVPTPPPSFLNFTSKPFTDGNWSMMLNSFHAAPFEISSVFLRKYGAGAEEFLLGLLSVLLIAVMSDIVYAFLMHTRRKKAEVFVAGLQTAVLVDEVIHFRNIWEHMRARSTWLRRLVPALAPSGDAASSVAPGHPPPTASQPLQPAGKDDEEPLPPGARDSPALRHAAARRHALNVFTSIKVLVLALLLLAFDVLVVYLTQPVTLESSNKQYNLRTMQPSFTQAGHLKFVRRMTRERPCVTPTFVDALQKREFTISACLAIREDKQDDDENVFEGPIVIETYFHEAGSDHYVSFSNSELHLRTRAVLFMSDATNRRFLFQTNDSDFRKTQFLHELAIYGIIETSCNNNETRVSCQDSLQRLTSSRRTRTRTLEKWRARSSAVKEEVVGLETTFETSLDRPWTSVETGLYPLVSTAVIQEVAGSGAYIHTSTEERLDDIPGLLTEEARVAGIMSFIVMLAGLSILLIVLRAVLRPLSLGAVAWQVSDLLSEAGSAGSSSSSADGSEPRTSLDKGVGVEPGNASELGPEAAV